MQGKYQKGQKQVIKILQCSASYFMLVNNYQNSHNEEEKNITWFATPEPCVLRPALKTINV